MTWPLPTPSDIANRAAAVYEQALPGIDARSPNTVAGVAARVLGMSGFDLYLYQSYIARELFPDTAVDFLDHHLSIWGITRVQPTAAADAITLNAAPGLAAPVTVPSGVALTAPSGARYVTSAGGTIPAGGSLVVGVVAAQAGSAGTLAQGVTLTLVSPIAGLTPQSGVVLGGAYSNPGTDLESDDSVRSRMLDRIRNPGAGGDAEDYARWAKEALSTVQYVSVIGGYAGLGTVGVFVGLAGPAVPSTAQLATIAAYISDPSRKPVTAQLIVNPVALQPVPVTIHLNPDTVATRAAAQQALALFFATDSQVNAPGQSGTGAPLYSTVDVSRLDDALSSADGEISHDRTAPAADVTAGAGVLLTLGALTFA